MMNYDEALAITGSTSSTSNNLRNTGVYYYLTSPSGVYNLWVVISDGTLDPDGYRSNGIRPVVVLKAGIKTTGKTTDLVGNENAWNLVAP